MVVFVSITITWYTKSGWRLPTAFLFLFPFIVRFFLDRVAEGADLFAEGEVLAVGVGGEGAFFDVEFAVFVDVSLVDIYRHDISYKHIVGAELHHVRHLALNAHGAFCDHRAV